MFLHTNIDRGIAMGSKQVMIQDGVYYRLKTFRDENEFRSFTEAVWFLLKRYDQYTPAGETSIPHITYDANQTTETVKVTQ
jgi:hypothetical protein